MKILKSIWAIIAGFLTVVILATVTDMILENTGVFPSMEYQTKYGFNELWMQLLSLFYRFIYTILAGFVTAKLAPSQPMRHVYILLTIATVLSVVGLLFLAPKGVLPAWYAVALVAIGFPSLWIGGKLAIRKKK